jgi:hypothetical protein
MKKLFLISLIFLSCSPKEEKWENLIINNSLDGWHIFQDDGTKKGWSVKDNILIFDTLSSLESGQADASILSNKMYSSFEIVFDWKIEEGGNSGFMWGVREDAAYKFPYQTGQEIQIIDVAAYETPEQILGGEIEIIWVQFMIYMLLQLRVRRIQRVNGIRITLRLTKKTIMAL